MPDLSSVNAAGVAALAVFLMWRLSAGAIDRNTRAVRDLAALIQSLLTDKKT